MKVDDIHIVVLSAKADAEDLRDNLVALGYEWVTTCSSVDELRSLFQIGRPDIIFINLTSLADENERKACVSFLMYADIPFVMVTASLDEHVLYQVRNTEPGACVSRPYDLRELRTAIMITLSKVQFRNDQRDREIWSLSTLLALQDALIATDLERRITFMNPAAEALTGWKLSEAIHTNVLRVFHTAEQGSKKIAGSLRTPVPNEKESYQTVSQSSLIAKDGREIQVEHSTSVVKNCQDSPAGFVMVFRDIHDRKRAEMQLKHRAGLYLTIAQTSLDFVVIVGKDGYIEFVNDSTAKAFGMKASEMLGRDYADFFSPKNKESHSKDLEAVLRTGEARTADILLKVQEQEHSFHCWLIPLPGEDNSVSAVMNVARDVTEQRRVRKQIPQAAVDLQELNEKKDRLLSILSHDLRNPFHALLGFCELIAQEADLLHADRVQHYTVVLQHALKKQYELLENILAWSRIQLNGGSVEPVRIDVHALVDAVLETMKPQIVRKDLHVNNQVAAMTNLVTDPLVIRSVLHNLLSNAVKFTPHGGSIHITANSADGLCHVTVRDTGVGMDRTLLGRIFDLQSIVSNPGTDNEPGTGLGLALCKEMLEKLGGSIRVESHPGAGSSFSVTLPAGSDQGNANIPA